MCLHGMLVWLDFLELSCYTVQTLTNFSFADAAGEKQLSCCSEQEIFDIYAV